MAGDGRSTTSVWARHSPRQPVVRRRWLSRPPRRSTWRVRASLPPVRTRLRRADGLPSSVSGRRTGGFTACCDRSTPDTQDHRLSRRPQLNSLVIVIVGLRIYKFGPFIGRISLTGPQIRPRRQGFVLSKDLHAVSLSPARRNKKNIADCIVCY